MRYEADAADCGLYPERRLPTGAVGPDSAHRGSEGFAAAMR